MLIKRLINLRFCLSFGAALTVASVLTSHRNGPAPNLEGDGIVFVYFLSACAAPGDSRDCREIESVAHVAFGSMAECSMHVDEVLKDVHDPRIMASCMKQREV